MEKEVWERCRLKKNLELTKIASAPSSAKLGRGTGIFLERGSGGR